MRHNKVFPCWVDVVEFVVTSDRGPRLTNDQSRALVEEAYLPSPWDVLDRDRALDRAAEAALVNVLPRTEHRLSLVVGWTRLTSLRTHVDGTALISEARCVDRLAGDR